MTCREVDNLLYPYLDGEFEPGDRLDLEQHLAVCSSCARQVHSQARFRELIRQTARAATVPAPIRLRQGIEASLRHVQRHRNLVWIGQISAAAALVLVAGTAYWFSRPNPRSRFIEDAARRHAKSLPLEVEQLPPALYQAWFAGKLDHRVQPPQLPNAIVAGARLSNVADKPAAYIVYEAPNGKGSSARRIGLFVIDDTKREIPTDAPPFLNLDSSHGYNVAFWRDREIVYELVSDLDEADIRQMLNSVINPQRPHRQVPTSPQGFPVSPPGPPIRPASSIEP